MFTISGVFSPVTIGAAVAEVGVGALMFAIDYPYETPTDAIRGFEAAELIEVERHARGCCTDR